MSIKTRGIMSVAVLAGGVSPEREISFSSGEYVCRALKEAGYKRIRMMDPADEGFVKEIAAGGFDVAFIALHGAGGEDGTIQGVLEYLHIPYTGSGVCASACAADKDITKIIFAGAGIPIARGIALDRARKPNVERIAAAVGEECFVKPALNGSSLGVTLVKKTNELRAAIELAFQSSDKVLVEERLVGTEITVGVIGGYSPRALPVVEIMSQPGSDFYNKDVKYIDPTLVHRIPAELPRAVLDRAADFAIEAHRALGCYGFSRSDFIVVNDSPVILETNTIPGMTESSLFPDEIRHADETFSDACAELIELALERERA